MATDKTLENVSGTGKAVLSSEIASRLTDPRFYAAMQVLPNPDAILRKMGRGQDIYDAIEYDAHVMGELRSIRAGLLAWEWRIQPGGEDPRDLQTFELCQKMFKDRPAKGCTWSDVIWNTARAVFHGFAVHEVVWKRDGSVLVPSMVVDRPHRRFHFDTDQQLRLITKTNLDPGEELGEYKWLLTRHMMRHDNPYGVAVLSSCFWPYTFKHNGYRWFSKFVERYGIPSPIGRYALGTQQSEIDGIVDALSKLLEDRVAVVPEGTSVELLETKVGAVSIHPEYINLCNRELSKALTSQTLSTEIQESGARAASETHHEREESGQESDREMVAISMTELCSWVTDLNVPGAQPPFFEFFQESETRKETAETFGIVTKYLDVSKTELYDRLQIQPPAEGDEVIGPSNPVSTPTNNSNAKFSACPSCGQTHQFVRKQDEIDELTGNATATSEKLISSMVEEVRKAVDDSSSFSELEEKLAALFPDLDDSEFAEQIEKAMLLAQLNGLDDG